MESPKQREERIAALIAEADPELVAYIAELKQEVEKMSRELYDAEDYDSRIKDRR